MCACVAYASARYLNVRGRACVRTVRACVRVCVLVRESAHSRSQLAQLAVCALLSARRACAYVCMPVEKTWFCISQQHDTEAHASDAAVALKVNFGKNKHDRAKSNARHACVYGEHVEFECTIYTYIKRSARMWLSCALILYASRVYRSAVAFLENQRSAGKWSARAC